MASQHPQSPEGKAPDPSTQSDSDDDQPVKPRRVPPSGQSGTRAAPQDKKKPRTVFSDWASI